MNRRGRWPWIAAGLALLGTVLWLRWPTLGFPLWNVDEAIHATIARMLLDGAVLYRDAVDLRAPLSYYAEAAVFAVGGENNLWAMRLLIAVVIAATALQLFQVGRITRGLATGIWAAALYAVLTSCLFSSFDAYASNTEWFVAFFSSAAAALFFREGLPRPRRLFAVGALLGGAFLAKQPGLLELAPPVLTLVWWSLHGSLRRTELVRRCVALGTGWAAVVLAACAYFTLHGALRDAVFFSWIYNVRFYGPEIAASDRAAALLVPFRLLLAGPQAWFLLLWLAGAATAFYRLVQRHPTPAESATNAPTFHLVIWSLVTLGGAASSGRDFEHYVIQFLPPFALGTGCVVARLSERAAARVSWGRRSAALLAAVSAVGALVAMIPGKRDRTIPLDPSSRVSAYIRAHSQPDDRIFVWGFQPEIYLAADRLPASRYVIASFVTGLIPWTNVAPEKDTTYAMIPGGLDALVQDLVAHSPRYIVDCSVGPNRHWQKYPPEKFPALAAFIREHYRQEESHQFLPQGFRLYCRRGAGEAAEEPSAEPPLSPQVLAALPLGTIGGGITPIRGSARFGTDPSIIEGRSEYFAHAPSSLVYRVTAKAGGVRGGFGIRAAAYAPENQAPTDGAEFIIKWRPLAGNEQVLLHRGLRPGAVAADRGLQFFHVALNPAGEGEIEFITDPGPSGQATSDWTFWSDLLLENYP